MHPKTSSLPSHRNNQRTLKHHPNLRMHSQGCTDSTSHTARNPLPNRRGSRSYLRISGCRSAGTHPQRVDMRDFFNNLHLSAASSRQLDSTLDTQTHTLPRGLSSTSNDAPAKIREQTLAPYRLISTPLDRALPLRPCRRHRLAVA